MKAIHHFLIFSLVIVKANVTIVFLGGQGFEGKVRLIISEHN